MTSTTESDFCFLDDLSVYNSRCPAEAAVTSIESGSSCFLFK
ncbi:hypothetical protein ZOSMA_67G00300 [Zostera marina]|uniref:Uncharacterized protein n=1 Tax=Zostera marina TaxID=29655 RepID=A0A0K9NU00_ZOSMR|nr:hypothetical protein ZOSMA_67G00300 [Zostera marina]